MSLLKDLAVSALNIGQSAFNNSLADKSAEKQYQRQLDFWEKQNKYNTPRAQRARVEAAGFNPASDLASQYAGASNSQGLEDVPGNDFAQSGVFDMSEFFANLESLSRMKKNGADVDLLEQQVKLAMVEYIIKNEEAFGLQLDNKKKQTLLKYIDQEGELTIEKLLAEIKNIESSTGVNIATEGKTVAEQGLIEEKTETEQATQGKIGAEQVLIEEQTEGQRIVNEYLPQEYQDRHSLNQQTIADLSSQIRNRSLQTEIQSKLADAEVRLKNQEFQYKDKVNPLLEEAQSLANEVTEATRDNIITQEQATKIQNSLKDLEYRVLNGTASAKEIFFYYAEDIVGALNANFQNSLDRSHNSKENAYNRTSKLFDRLLSLVDFF